MKRTLVTITILAQLTAVGAFADTTSKSTEKAGSTVGSTSYGSDWSKTLVAAMFSTDGTTLRSDNEMMEQWKTISPEDKAMVQRDCLKYGQQGTADTSATTDSTATAAATGTTADSTTKSSTGTTTGTTSPAANATLNVTMAQMTQICADTKGM